MAQTTLEKVVEDVKTLTPDEQKQLRGLLDEWLAPPPRPQITEEEFLRLMEEKGIVQPREPGWLAAWSKFDPVPIQGKPLSETVIEDRGER